MAQAALDMENKLKNLIYLFAIACLTVVPLSLDAQGMGQGNQKDMQLIHKLLTDHTKIQRTIKKLPNGVETLTESTDPKVTAIIQEHALAMQKRMAEGRPIRMWDPLFAELFANASKVKMTVTKTKNGVKVVETSESPYVATLVQWHAEGVNGFVKDGMAGMHKSHPAPPKPNAGVQPKFLGMGDGVKTCPVTGEQVEKSISAKIQGRTVYFCCAGCVETVVKEPNRYLKWAKPAGAPTKD